MSKDYKNSVRFIKKYDGKEWNYEAIIIGSETPLYKFISAFVKMNFINFSKEQ